MTLDVDRAQVLAYRVAANGFGRETGDPAELGVLDLGVQDSQAHTARLALAARLPAACDDPLTRDGRFAVLWTFRGAPHLHRRVDLPGLMSELWPRSDADAAARLGEWPRLKATGQGGLAVFTAAAEAMHAVVTEPLTKGEVSGAVTARLPEEYAYWCRSCRARHIYGGIFQQVGLPAGVRLVPDAAPTTLAPLEGRPPVPSAGAGAGELIRGYLRLHGPATLAEAAGYLGTTQAQARPVWPDGLAEVRVDGRRAWIPAERLDALRTASPPRLVRLLPPLDPYLQARDRDLVVPGKDRQKALWRILGSPGALLVDGEVAGVWRARMAGRARLEVTVEPFAAPPAAVRTAVEDEAGHLAAVRNATDVQVRYSE